MSSSLAVGKCKRRTKEQLQQRQREATAYHEAGHCVVALVLRECRPYEIPIEPNPAEGYRGMVKDDSGWFLYDLEHGILQEWPPERMPMYRRAAERDVKILLASHLAQHRFAPRTAHWPSFYLDKRPGSDYDRCKRLLAPFMAAEASEEEKREEIERNIERLWKETQSLVRQPLVWADITFLATAFLRPPTLEGDALDEVFEQLPARAKRENARQIRDGSGQPYGH